MAAEAESCRSCPGIIKAGKGFINHEVHEVHAVHAVREEMKGIFILYLPFVPFVLFVVISMVPQAGMIWQAV